MRQEKQLTIMEFSKMTGIKRENLRFYDRIGLLCPEIRGENNYRYYTRRQLNMAYLIANLRGLGVGIEDIKRYAAHRIPETTLALFAQQELRIREEMRNLEETSLILSLQSGMIQEALSHNEDEVFLEEKPREPIFLCPPVPEEMNEEEYGVFAYEYAEAQKVNLGFPCGALIPEAVINSGAAGPPLSYYFKGAKENTHKPAGLYAVAYGSSVSWQVEPIYQRLLSFIREQGLTICGDCFEEYPTGDSVEHETDPVRVRLEVPVTRR